MVGMEITRSIGVILSIAALLACLSMAQPVEARAIQVASLRDSVVPIVIDPPPQESAVDAQGVDDSSVSKLNDTPPGLDNAVDGPADLLTPLADVPWAAWLLLGTCVLCARFGPRALQKFEDEPEEPTRTGPDQTDGLHKPSLPRPRRSPG
jgi:hypothetical protein